MRKLNGKRNSQIERQRQKKSKGDIQTSTQKEKNRETGGEKIDKRKRDKEVEPKWYRNCVLYIMVQYFRIRCAHVE